LGIWRNIARLAQAGSVQGVVEPGPTDVLTPAQAVQVIDDVSHAVQPVLVPVAYYLVTTPAVAVRFATIEITGGPRGTLLRYGQGVDITASAIANTDNIELFTGLAGAQANRVVQVAVANFGPAVVHAVTIGDRADPVTQGWVHRQTQSGWNPWDLFIGPGEVAQFVASTVNTARGMAFLLQDVP